MILIETDKEKTIKTRIIGRIKHFIDPPTMVKMGYTVKQDVLDRFTEKHLKENNFINIAPEVDFIPDVQWSGWFRRELIDYYEDMWEKNFPKNIWTTKRYTGYSEYRYMPEQQIKQWAKKLHKMYPFDKHYEKKGYLHLYFTKFDRKKKTEYDDE